ncbi:MAG: glycosyltransferase family 2 protein [Dehalococcoidales bacterium]|nr:glycosyltransferase family 2 protein [Dehalococcoidales bacterium]
MSDTAYEPLVSIITPVLNGAKYLEICLKSVLAQSYPNIEHIFVDGGSTDGTLDILAGYQSKYPQRIKFITGTDKGVGEAVNKGFAVARGSIFGWIDTDDAYETNAIQTIVKFFGANQNAFLVYGGCNMIDEGGKFILKMPTTDFDRQRAVNDTYHIIFCAAFYKREVIEKVGGLNTLGNDLDFWLRASQEFQLHRIDATLARWRMHKDSISGSNDAAKANIRRARLREDFILGRRYGASLFSPRSRRYYRFRVMDGLHLYPLYFKFYRLVNRMLGRTTATV